VKGAETFPFQDSGYRDSHNFEVRPKLRRNLEGYSKSLRFP